MLMLHRNLKCPTSTQSFLFYLCFASEYKVIFAVFLLKTGTGDWRKSRTKPWEGNQEKVSQKNSTENNFLLKNIKTIFFLIFLT